MVLLLTLITGLNKHAVTMNERRNAIIAEAGYSEENDPYPENNEDINSLSEEEKERYNATEEKIRKDSDYARAQMLFINISIIIITFSILFSFLIFEFLIPLLFKNGQTLGKKVFGVAVMRADGVKLPADLLFLRAIVCKFTLETMTPVMALLAAVLLQWWAAAIILIFGMAALQIILFLFTKEHTPIHDICTYTVTVDMASQKIFNNAEEKAEYIAKIQKELAEDNRDY